MLEATFINDEVSRDLRTAVRFAREQDLGAIELRMIGDANVVDLDPDEIDAIRRTLEEAELRVAALSTPLFKCPLREDSDVGTDDPFQAASRRWRDHLDLLPRAADVARRLGTRRLRCFAFLGSGDYLGARDEILERLAAAGDLLRREAPDAKLCLENEPSTYVRRAPEAGDAVDALGEPFEVLWDPGNAYYAGERRPLLGFEEVRGRVGHIHAKDPRTTARGIGFVPLGDGEIDYPAHVRAWARSGYRGYVSLEPHLIVGESSLEGARRCLEHLKPLLAGAEEPT